MITPLDKIRVMRLYEVNPSAGILMLADLLRADIERGIIPQIEEKVLAMVRKDVVGIDKMLKDIRGEDGTDAKPEDVARVLLSSPSFIASIKGRDATPVAVSDVVSALIKNKQFMQAVRGEDGDSPEIKDIISAIQADSVFMDMIRGENGDDSEVCAEDIAAMLRSDPVFIASLKGEQGSPDTAEQIAQKLNTNKQSVEQDVIIGLPMLIQHFEALFRAVNKGGSRNKMNHGGGDKVVAGNNITITRNSDGTVTIASTATGGGSGVSIITVSGTVNNSNTSFTASSEPSLLVINGEIYKPTGGEITWSYSGGTITLSEPVGTGGSIFGLAEGSGGGGGGSSWTISTPAESVGSVSYTAVATPLFIVVDGITLFEGAGYTLAGLVVTPDNDAVQYIRIYTGSSSISIETPSGSGTSFTVTATPLYIVADGATYFNGAGYSLSGLNVTMDNPVTQFIRSFHL